MKILDGLLSRQTDRTLIQGLVDDEIAKRTQGTKKPFEKKRGTRTDSERSFTLVTVCPTRTSPTVREVNENVKKDSAKTAQEVMDSALLVATAYLRH